MLTHIPHGLAEIVATYGDASAPSFEQLCIVSFDLPYPLLYDGKPVHRSRCHKLLVENFQFAFERIKSAGLEAECKNYGGIFAKRAKRGSSKASTHSWGIAIDLEPYKYPLGSKARMPDAVVGIWKEAGFGYGGDFAKRLDPMHFQCAVSY